MPVTLPKKLINDSHSVDDIVRELMFNGRSDANKEAILYLLSISNKIYTTNAPDAMYYLGWERVNYGSITMVIPSWIRGLYDNQVLYLICQRYLKSDLYSVESRVEPDTFTAPPIQNRKKVIMMVKLGLI